MCPRCLFSSHVGRRNAVRGDGVWSVTHLRDDRRDPTVWRQVRLRRLLKRRMRPDQSLRSAVQARDRSLSFRWRQDTAAPAVHDQQPHMRHTCQRHAGTQRTHDELAALASRGAGRVHVRRKASSCAQLHAPGRALCPLDPYDEHSRFFSSTDARRASPAEQMEPGPSSTAEGDGRAEVWWQPPGVRRREGRELCCLHHDLAKLKTVAIVFACFLR